MTPWQGGEPPPTAAIARPALLKIYGLQLLILVLVAAVLLLVDPVLGRSALIGGLIAVLPNAYFARLAFRYRGGRAAKAVAQSFYRGEAGKFAMTVILFALVFSAVRPLRGEALLLAFMGMTLVNTFFAWHISNQRVTSD